MTVVSDPTLEIELSDYVELAPTNGHAPDTESAYDTNGVPEAPTESDDAHVIDVQIRQSCCAGQQSKGPTGPRNPGSIWS